MVIGDQRGDAKRARARHAFDAGDAVVHGDQQVGLALSSELDQLGRQAITELEAIGHQIVDAGAEEAQRAHADGAGGGAVGVIVGDDQQPLAGLDRVGEQCRRLGHALEQRRRQEARGVVRQFGSRADAPRRIDPGEQRMDAGVEERAAIGFLVGALDDLHA